MFQKLRHAAGKLLSLMKKRQFLVTSITALVMLVVLITVWNHFILKDKYSMEPIVVVEGDENNDVADKEAALAKEGSGGDDNGEEQESTEAERPDLPEPDITAMAEPAAGQVVRTFGFTFSPTYEDYRYHGGIDVAASVDTPVNSVLEGIVSSVTYTEAEGHKVVIDHGGGWQSVYAHLASPQVKEGEKVNPGQLIARIGTPGTGETAVGHHVHLEIIHNENQVDPLQYLHYDPVLH